MKKIEYKWVALSCTSLGVLFTMLDSTSLTIALPSIMKDLNVSMNMTIWIVMIYMLTSTILVPPLGRLADMIGKKKLYVYGCIVFTIGSFLSGISQTGLQLLIFRVVQAIGGALLVANSAPIITDAFPPNELGKGLGINSMVFSVATVIGPLLGGLLLKLNWRYIFYINIPIGLLSAIWAGLQLKENVCVPKVKQKFDLIGTGIFTVGITLLLFALTSGAFIAWNTTTFLLMGVSVILLVIFVHIERSVRQPMLDLKLFKDRTISLSLITVFLNCIARGAIILLMTFYFQRVKSLDPFMCGLLLTPFAVSMVIVAPISGLLCDKRDAYAVCTIGLIISAIGFIGLSRISSDSSSIALCIWTVISGIGSGLFFTPNASAVMGAAAPEQRGIVSGIRTMMLNAGCVISIALSMALISSGIDPATLQGLFIGTAASNESIAVNGFISGLRFAFIISLVISLIAIFLSLMMGLKKAPNGELSAKREG